MDMPNLTVRHTDRPTPMVMAMGRTSPALCSSAGGTAATITMITTTIMMDTTAMNMAAADIGAATAAMGAGTAVAVIIDFGLTPGRRLVLPGPFVSRDGLSRSLL